MERNVSQCEEVRVIKGLVAYYSDHCCIEKPLSNS